MTMRREWHFDDGLTEVEVIARFGSVELVKDLSGKLELRGGSDEDRRQAKEWMDKFMPNAAGLKIRLQRIARRD